MEKNIAVIRGDGIGPEIVAQAVAVLERVAERFGHRFTFTEAEMGGCAIDRYGLNLPEESLRMNAKQRRNGCGIAAIPALLLIYRRNACRPVSVPFLQ